MGETREGIVYHLFCTKTGKAYVGQTWKTLDERWSRHCKPSSCIKIWRAIQRHGPNSFVRTVLTKCYNQLDLNAAEIYWIKYFDCIDNGYNLNEGGGNGCHSKETLLRMSEGKKGALNPNFGKKFSEERKNQMRKSSTGRKHTPEACLKIGDAHRGMRHSEETKQKLRNASAGKQGYWSGRIMTEDHRAILSKAHGGRPFVCIETGEVFETQARASQTLGVRQAHISEALGGKRKRAGAYTFRYTENIVEVENS